MGTLDPAATDRIIAQGRALVRAIEGLGEIDPTGPVERTMAGLLLRVYKRWLRGLVEASPPCLGIGPALEKV